MFIKIDNKSSLPNYLQIENQIKQLILKGELKQGDKLPSIRSLSAELNIAIITIKRAYEELEKDHIVFTEAGKGVFVAQIDQSEIKRSIAEELRGDLAKTVNKAKSFGFSDEEIEEMIRSVYE